MKDSPIRVSNVSARSKCLKTAKNIPDNPNPTQNDLVQNQIENKLLLKPNPHSPKSISLSHFIISVMTKTSPKSGLKSKPAQNNNFIVFRSWPNSTSLSELIQKLLRIITSAMKVTFFGKLTNKENKLPSYSESYCSIITSVPIIH